MQGIVFEDGEGKRHSADEDQITWRRMRGTSSYQKIKIIIGQGMEVILLYV